MAVAYSQHVCKPRVGWFSILGELHLCVNFKQLFIPVHKIVLVFHTGVSFLSFYYSSHF